jgi:hypothetical protein
MAMEAASTSETSVSSTRLHGTTSQKTVIFIVHFVFQAKLYKPLGSGFVILRMDKDPVSETLCSLENTRRWTKYRNPVIAIEIYYRQNLLELESLTSMEIAAENT